MIEPAYGLTDSALEAIAGLERQVVAADGGRLKLEWGALRSRAREQVRDLLWWDGDRLLGFVGIYDHGSNHLELTGMVEPAARRSGIGRTLLDAALPYCGEQGKARLLLVVPRDSAGGAALARSRGMTFDHSEHALMLRSRPKASAGPAITLRQAVSADIPACQSSTPRPLAMGRSTPTAWRAGARAH